jgi:beta-1,4-mannosyl-glycoprotein beta-1,4-N-acetylglucosaminyltransferase
MEIMPIIYDCFTFNDELDILELRLKYLEDKVDFFVLVESRKTFTGIKKPLYFLENMTRFLKYKNKIIHLIIDDFHSDIAWENEYYQRNFIKKGLIDCNDSDLIFISDVDEIPQIGKIVTNYKISKPRVVPLRNFYYYFNNLMYINHKFTFHKILVKEFIFYNTIVSRYKYIKEINIGKRDNFKSQFGVLSNLFFTKPLGYHFSYLFGCEIDRYLKKLESFSHTELNTEYFKNRERVSEVINKNLDIFNRNHFTFKYKDPEKVLDSQILEVIYHLGYYDLIVKKNDK